MKVKEKVKIHRERTCSIFHFGFLLCFMSNCAKYEKSYKKFLGLREKNISQI